MKTVDGTVVESEAVECPDCEHVHSGTWERDDGDDREAKWCDVPCCGDGCCHCPCFYDRELVLAS